MPPSIFDEGRPQGRRRRPSCTVYHPRSSSGSVPRGADARLDHRWSNRLSIELRLISLELSDDTARSSVWTHLTLGATAASSSSDVPAGVLLIRAQLIDGLRCYRAGCRLWCAPAIETCWSIAEQRPNQTPTAITLRRNHRHRGRHPWRRGCIMMRLRTGAREPASTVRHVNDRLRAWHRCGMDGEKLAPAGDPRCPISLPLIVLAELAVDAADMALAHLRAVTLLRGDLRGKAAISTGQRSRYLVGGPLAIIVRPVPCRFPGERARLPSRGHQRAASEGGRARGAKGPQRLPLED